MNPCLNKMIALGLALGACASTTAPTSSMAAAQASIRVADEMGARQNPSAALYLQYAREEYSQADTANREGRGGQAQRLLLRAQADADLAVALARRNAAREGAAATQGGTSVTQTTMDQPR